MISEISLPKILFLVDDDQDDKEIFQEALNLIDNKITLYTASDGREALRKLHEALVLPDIVFMDLNMPIMGGKDCLKALKLDRQLKKIPVIIYSTSAEAKEKENCLKLGASHYISKPPQFDSLVSTLKETLASEWR